MISKTFLQCWQQPYEVPAVPTPILLGWYQALRRIWNAPFEFVGVVPTGELRTFRYRDGVCTRPGAPLLQSSFSGTLVGFGTGQSFRLLMVVDEQQQPAFRTARELEEFGARCGVRLAAREVFAPGRVVDAVRWADDKDTVIFFPGNVSLISKFGRTNRSSVLVKLVAPVPAAVPEDTLPVIAPRQVAALIGTLRQPASYYVELIKQLGYMDVVELDIKSELPEDVKLVVYGVKAKKPDLVKQAEACGIPSLSASELKEKARAQTIRRGG